MPEAEDAEKRLARAQRLRENIEALRRRSPSEEATPPESPSPREFTDDAASQAAEKDRASVDFNRNASSDDAE